MFIEHCSITKLILFFFLANPIIISYPVSSELNNLSNKVHKVLGSKKLIAFQFNYINFCFN